jgi:hypothetical protein
MENTPVVRGLGAFVVASIAVSSYAPVAHAHLSLEQGGTHMSRYGDDEIKDGPCGRDGGARGENVYTYEPGSTITIKAKEFIPHPGYFRIAFDSDGDDGFLDPQSIKPIDPERACPYDANDKCGESDFFNNETVLMDNLDPHLSNGQPTYTWEVKLPDIECDNCTLQIIQVMEDTVHGPYAPKGTANEIFYIEDIYHTCIDVVLARGANPDDNPEPPPVEDDGSDGSADDQGDDTVDDGVSTDDGAANDDGDTSGEPTEMDDSPATATTESSSGCNVSPASPRSRGLALAWMVPAFVYLALVRPRLRRARSGMRARQ